MELLGNRGGKKKRGDDHGEMMSEDYTVISQESKKLIPYHYDSFEHYDYTKSISHLTTVHPSLHKKNKINNGIYK